VSAPRTLAELAIKGTEMQDLEERIAEFEQVVLDKQ